MPTLPFKLNQAGRRHIPRQKHKVTNWPAYDASLRQRGSLTVWFSDEGLWCVIRVLDVAWSLEALSGDALRHWHPEPGHPVEHRAADPGFGLLGRQSPGAKTTTDEGFVAEHGGLPKRAPAVADCLLPAQAPLVPDRLDMLVPLMGRGARGRARHGG